MAVSAELARLKKEKRAEKYIAMIHSEYRLQAMITEDVSCIL